MAARSKEHDGASPAKIFVGGLPKDTNLTTFKEHFGKYGDIDDIVIMKDRNTHKPRGFGFVTFHDPSVVDKVIEETQIINGKQVEIKRTIPKGAAPLKDFKTKKIFVGGIPTTLTEDEFWDFFSKFGKVIDHEIIRDHATNRSRGFGFIVFDNEKTVDELLAKKGNMIDLAGSQVEIKKAEPKKPSNPPPSAYGSESRDHPFGDDLGFGSSYSGFGSGMFGPSSYRTPGGLGPRPGGFGGYGGVASEFGGGYSGYGGGLGDYQAESSLGYSSRLGSYGGYGRGYGGSGLGGYGREAGGYGGSGYGGAYGSPGSAYRSGLYGSRGGYGGAGRYHPYAR
ncbi:uncharacterized protein [Elaeis guineensis]|uniref:Heterogeneous nuclear ribonucleoprotein 1 n=1 Tax=Elaeis guineensis var. tenera TaxID=51953 RepID=A0A6I9SGI6_ELAGV|nr:heterogeneous nuclear ribonucleoprotein 1 [Elaeis guineensis]XP_010942578.1 heterogeneous nuclear ribonucleoprotein 1 [Elaeis guineensis]